MSYLDLHIAQELVQSPYEKCLVACLVAKDAADLPQIDALYKKCQDLRLFQFAQIHECASIVAARLQALGKSSPRWDNELDTWKYRLHQRFERLEGLATALKHENIPFMAIEEAGIARGIYRHDAECPMDDLAGLVRKDDFRRAHEIVMDLGYALENSATKPMEELVDEGFLRGELDYAQELADDVLSLKLRWHPLGRSGICADIDACADEWFREAIKMPPSDMAILAPEDNLLQVALRTASLAYVRAPGIRIHADVDRIVRGVGAFDWSLWLEKVRKMRATTAVFFSLAIPRAIFETPIPDEVLDALEPPKFRRNALFSCLKKAGIFHPSRAKFPFFRDLMFRFMICDAACDGLRLALSRDR